MRADTQSETVNNLLYALLIAFTSIGVDMPLIYLTDCSTLEMYSYMLMSFLFLSEFFIAFKRLSVNDYFLYQLSLSIASCGSSPRKAARK